MEKRIYDEKFYFDELAKDIFLQLEKNILYSDTHNHFPRNKNYSNIK